MSLRCGNEAGDSAKFGARGVCEGRTKETNCFAFPYLLETWTLTPAAGDASIVGGTSGYCCRSAPASVKERLRQS
jgi:hypothetical protein